MFWFVSLRDGFRSLPHMPTASSKSTQSHRRACVCVLYQEFNGEALIEHRDSTPHIPQVVFYQSGVGTFGDKVLEELDGREILTY